MAATFPITSIVGTWYIDGMPFGEDGILVIMQDGRTIQFPTSITKPHMNQTMRMWHSAFDGESIRFRNSPNGSSWHRGVEASSTGWAMIAESDGKISRFHCCSADLKTLPIWFSEMLEKNLARMSQLEQEQNNGAEGVDPGDLTRRESNPS
ncbi:MAG: hypothetical protein ACI8UO_005002 [Verrucomicrobiales bacterium]|jgi:hypothetical protein